MISLEDFLKLSDEEKAIRHHELSPNDRLIARMSDWKPADTVVLKHAESSSDIERQKLAMEQLEKAIERGEVHLLERD